MNLNMTCTMQVMLVFTEQEHKNSISSIGKHFREKYSLAPGDLAKNFCVLKKCTNKFDCLLYKMLFIQELRPAPNV